MIRAPGMPRPGEPATAPVELVDVFPTVASLAGLTPPAHLDGRSLGPSLEDPAAPGRDVAWSQFSRPWKPADPRLTGYSLRDATHRYTRWIDPAVGRTVAEELYDLGRLPGAGDGAATLVEMENVVGRPEAAAARARRVLLRSGPSASSDVAVLPDGRVLCVFESGLPGVEPAGGKRRLWAYACIAARILDPDELFADGDSAADGDPRAPEAGADPPGG